MYELSLHYTTAVLYIFHQIFVAKYLAATLTRVSEWCNSLHEEHSIHFEFSRLGMQQTQYTGISISPTNQYASASLLETWKSAAAQDTEPSSSGQIGSVPAALQIPM